VVVEGTAPLRILGQTAYPWTVASARVRVANYGAFLRKHGLELDFSPTLSSEDYRVLSSGATPARKAARLCASAARAAADHPAHDLFLIHRLRYLHPLPGLDPPRRLDAYDLDDALFLGSAAEVNRRVRWAKQEARRCVACMRRARLVIAGNGFLAAHARAYSRRVEVVPTCVDPDRQPLHRHEQPEVVTIGWIGSHTTACYLRPVLPVLAALNRQRTVARLIVIGGDTGVREAWIEHRSWALEEEPDVLASFDIGVMPLPDTDWARGKCGYKLLQYFSAGVPAVASPVGVASSLVGDGRGLAASTPDEWRTALTRLIEDVDERRERGSVARAFAERDYSYQRWAPELAALLRSLAG
jgi:glycosyltransferase involved in cell wall biosynthesis